MKTKKIFTVMVLCLFIFQGNTYAYAAMNEDNVGLNDEVKVLYQHEMISNENELFQRAVNGVHDTNRIDLMRDGDKNIFRHVELENSELEGGKIEFVDTDEILQVRQVGDNIAYDVKVTGYAILNSKEKETTDSSSMSLGKVKTAMYYTAEYNVATGSTLTNYSVDRFETEWVILDRRAAIRERNVVYSIDGITTAGESIYKSQSFWPAGFTNVYYPNWPQILYSVNTSQSTKIRANITSKVLLDEGPTFYNLDLNYLF